MASARQTFVLALVAPGKGKWSEVRAGEGISRFGNNRHGIELRKEHGKNTGDDAQEAAGRGGGQVSPPYSQGRPGVESGSTNLNESFASFEPFSPL